MAIIWYTPEEVALRWRTSPQTIIREIRSRKLPAMPLGRSYRIHHTVIEQREEAARTMAADAGKPRRWRPLKREQIPDYIGD